MARIPRIPQRSDIENLDLRKRPSPMGRKEELHERMARELTNLKRDRRFWEGDKAYQRYVQRQFERVYNDPSGQPQPLRIGPPKIFATDIEPFVRHENKQTSHSSVASKHSLKQRGMANAAGTGRHPRQNVETSETTPEISGQSTDPTASESPKAKDRMFRRSGTRSTDSMWDKFIGLVDVYFTDRDDPVESGQAKAQETLKQFRQLNWPTAEMLLNHFLSGSGEDVTVPAEFVKDYRSLDEGYEGVLENFSRWFVGDIADSNFGAAVLPMREGAQITLGIQHGRRNVSLDDLVMWESAFPGAGETLNPIDKLALDDEVHASIGGGTLQGYATSLTLVRVGNTVRITGVMQFRVEDEYVFDLGHWLDFDQLQDAGLAKAFWVRSEPWTREVEGVIVLRDGEPVSSKIWVTDDTGLTGKFPD